MDFYSDENFREYIHQMMTSGSPAGPTSAGSPSSSPLTIATGTPGIPSSASSSLVDSRRRDDPSPSSATGFVHDAERSAFVAYGAAFRDAGVVSFDGDHRSPAAAATAASYSAAAGGDVTVEKPQDEKGAAARRSKKRRKRRDPNKPKGWVSAAMMFANAHRKRVQFENPDTSFGDIMRLLMAQYSELPDEERDLWERAQANEKARYEREMLVYVPPSTPAEGSEDDDPIGESGMEVTTGAMPPLALAAAAEEVAEETSEEEERPPPKKKKSGRKKKDPAAPKMPLTTWSAFVSGEARRRVRAERPDAKFGEVLRILAARYKELTEAQMETLRRLVKVDEERYDREMEEYRASKVEGGGVVG